MWRGGKVPCSAVSCGTSGRTAIRFRVTLQRSAMQRRMVVGRNGGGWHGGCGTESPTRLYAPPAVRFSCSLEGRSTAWPNCSGVRLPRSKWKATLGAYPRKHVRKGATGVVVTARYVGHPTYVVSYPTTRRNGTVACRRTVCRTSDTVQHRPTGSPFIGSTLTLAEPRARLDRVTVG